MPDQPADDREVLATMTTTNSTISTPPSIDPENTPEKNITAVFLQDKQAVQRSLFPSTPADKQVKENTLCGSSGLNISAKKRSKYNYRTTIDEAVKKGHRPDVSSTAIRPQRSCQNRCSNPVFSTLALSD